MDGLNQQIIAEVVRQFYDRVRADEVLGPVFSVVEDWDEHLVRLSEFWSSVALMSGQYKGNPLAIHLVHIGSFKPEMFGRWLTLWKETTGDLLSAHDASLLQAKAARIASRFQMAMFPTLNSLPPFSEPGPYKTSREFTHLNLPLALLRMRRLDKGIWIVIRIKEGEILLFKGDPPSGRLIQAGTATIVHPETLYRLEVAGPVKLSFEFHDRKPASLID